MLNYADKYEPCAGVIFYSNDSEEIIDIEVSEFVETVVFDWKLPNAKFHLRNVFKQFENVKEIIIQPYVLDIDISNFMFPNVRTIESRNDRYLSGSTLVEIPYNVLLNTFCLKSNEAINISQYDSIGEYAFEGCDNVIITDGPHSLTPFYHLCLNSKSFKGSVYEILQLKQHGYVSYNNILVNINNAMDSIYADDISEIARDIDFGATKIILNGVRFLNQVLPSNFNPSNVVFYFNQQLLPFSVATIKYNIMNISQRPDLKSLEVTGPYAPVKTQGGMILSKDGKELIRACSYLKGHLTVPDNIERIAEGAFSYNMSITSVTLPESVLYVGVSAFRRCINLKDISLPENLHVIENFAFAESGLNAIEIPRNTKKIYREAFYGCDNLKTVKICSSDLYLGRHALISANTIIFDDNVTCFPKGIFNSYVSYRKTKTDDDKYVELVYKNNKIYIPKRISKANVHILNYLYDEPFENVFSDKERCIFTYQTASDSFSKYEVAFKSYEYTKSETLKKYLKKIGKRYAEDLIISNNAKRLSELLHEEILSKNALAQLLELAQSKNQNIVVGYILSALGNTEVKTETFKL